MRADLAAFVQKNKIQILFILLLFVGASAFVVFYTSVEKAFYVWDNENYYRFTNELFQHFKVTFGDGLYYLLDSLNNDYNVYYALPLQPFFFIAGNSRPVYEVALVVVYLIPFILVTGLIGCELLETKARQVFWLLVVVALLLPAVWLPTLRAYPDTAAALASALATLVYLKDPSLKRLGRLLLFGLLIGLAALLRRHFAYTALSFLGAAGVVALVRFAGEVRLQAGKAAHHLVKRILQLTLAAIFALLTVTVFNPQVVVKTLVIDFNQLYSSYLVPWSQELGWFLDGFGWLPSGVALVGIYLLWRYSGRKEEVLFFGLFGLFELLLWVFYVRQISIQYTLHLTVFIVVGLVAFLFYSWKAVKARARTRPPLYPAAVGLGGVFLVVNCLAGGVLPSGTTGANLFSTNWQPLIRDDYQQVINLTNYLDQQTNWENPVYVVASSYRFNSHTFLAANRAATGQTSPTINLLPTPDIDSRDFYPLENLVKASMVVVIDPVEYQLAPDQQQVVKVAYDMFKQNRALAQDFTVLNENFAIDARTKAIVYKRVKAPSVQTTLATLQMIQDYVKQKPGGQFAWINLDPQKPLKMTPTVNWGTELEIDPGKWATRPSGEPGKAGLVYAWPLTGQERYQGKVTFGKDDCGAATLDFSARPVDKSPVQFAEYKAKPGTGQDFEVNFSKGPPGQFVLLEVTPPAQPGCSIKVDLDPVK